MSEAKNPVLVAAGRRGAQIRWGSEPRVVRLDELDPPKRRLVIALIDAARTEQERADLPPAA